jgi:hypothetical protein
MEGGPVVSRLILVPKGVQIVEADVPYPVDTDTDKLAAAAKAVEAMRAAGLQVDVLTLLGAAQGQPAAAQGITAHVAASPEPKVERWPDYLCECGQGFGGPDGKTKLIRHRVSCVTHRLFVSPDGLERDAEWTTELVFKPGEV